MIILCKENCLYKENKITIYGQMETLTRSNYKELNIFYNNEKINHHIFFKGTDFWIKIQENINNTINKYYDFIFYFHNNKEISIKKVQLSFPFESNKIHNLNPDKSSIISTMCKNYSHRLEEWIQYNLKLGFSGIIIFNNDENKRKNINESLENCNTNKSMKQIVDKYKEKVLFIDFPYTPLSKNRWDTIQRLSFYIGIHGFKDKCKYISLIDADEFIYIPKNSKMNIEDFLNQYSKTICIKSNLLTNKNNDDYIDNNVIQLAKYVGGNKFSKIILYTKDIEENEFIITPHKYKNQIMLSKNKIIHYHVWINNRLHYNSNMPYIDLLEIFFKG